MVVERTINVGFHSNFDTFRQSEHSLEGFSIRMYYGIAIALIIHSLDPSLSTQLIAHYPFA